MLLLLRRQPKEARAHVARPRFSGLTFRTLNVTHAVLQLMIVFPNGAMALTVLRRRSLLPSRKGTPMKCLHGSFATLLMLCLVTAARAQKVVLYEAEFGTQFVGSAVWRTDRVPPGPGQKPDVVVRAEIEIPEQKVQVRLSLRRNDDKQFPASHAVEIAFRLPPDFPHGGVSMIPGLMMKQAETTRGVPLNGVGVKLAANLFMVGLTSVDLDMQRNIQLLKDPSWFDIPVVYSDGRRAIIAIEKGIPGERAFTEAFATWGQ